MDRRVFFGAMAAAVAAVAAPFKALAAPDDWGYLQAKLDRGELVEDGCWRISRPLILRSSGSFRGNVVKMTGDHPTAIWVAQDFSGEFRNNAIIGGGLGFTVGKFDLAGISLA